LRWAVRTLAKVNHSHPAKNPGVWSLMLATSAKTVPAKSHARPLKKKNRMGTRHEASISANAAFFAALGTATGEGITRQ